MNSKQIEGKRLFVLDTNILMHDPTSLFRVKEHDIFLPMIVLEELDNNKKGTTEVARNARQSSRFLDEMMSGVSPEDIEEGVDLLSEGARRLLRGLMGEVEPQRGFAHRDSYSLCCRASALPTRIN